MAKVNTAVNPAGAIARITRELAEAHKNEDLSIRVTCQDQDVRFVRALIIGPPETPYEFGFFEFDLKFPREYPNQSPNVRAITTNSNKTRFNPNIYAEGKVCLSILGTWRGERGEEWSSAQGLESVLLSIQSLMSSNPYENEPGFEGYKKDSPSPAAYVQKIRHETLRVSVVQRLEKLLQIKGESAEPAPKRQKRELAADVEAVPPGSPKSDGSSTPDTEPSTHEYDAETASFALDDGPWDPYHDLVKRRFLWYYDAYLRTIEKHSKEQADGTLFKRMEFEYPPNSMEGVFDYKGLYTRLEIIRKTLDQEKHSWQKLGAKQVEEGTQLATQLAFQFEQLRYKWNETQYDGSRLEVSLVDRQNPFVWHLTLFGEPMTHLDGGIFNMDMHIPPTFPATQPRLHVTTPIFHHRVSSTGTLCYFPEKEDEIASHLQAVVKAFGDQDAKFDPRAMVNPESFALRWGSEADRKTYHRKLRRSAQESGDFT